MSEGRTSFCLVHRKIASSIRRETHSDGFSIGRSSFPRYFESHASIARNPCKGPLEYDQRFENATRVPFVFRAKALFFSFPLLPFIFRPCFPFFLHFLFFLSFPWYGRWLEQNPEIEMESKFTVRCWKSEEQRRCTRCLWRVLRVCFSPPFSYCFSMGDLADIPHLSLFRNISDRTAFQHFYAVVRSFCFFAISNRTVHRIRHCDLRKRMVLRPKKGSSYER